MPEDERDAPAESPPPAEEELPAAEEDGDPDLDLDSPDDELDEPDEGPAVDEPVPPGERRPGSHRDSRRRRLEKLVPDLLKRAIERGIEAGLNSLGNTGRGKPEARPGEPRSEGTIPPPPPKDSKEVGPRELASVPKEIAGYVFSQIDDTKNAMVRVVAREVREFLEAADLATELQKALTTLSFEIRTEIRFIPNEAGGIKPEVKAAMTPRTGKARPPGRRPTALADEELDDDER